MRKILPYILGIFAVLALLISAALLLNPDRYRSQIAATLSQRLKHKVLIGKIEIRYFPPSLFFKHMAVISAQGWTITNGYNMARAVESLDVLASVFAEEAGVDRREPPR